MKAEQLLGVLKRLAPLAPTPDVPDAIWSRGKPRRFWASLGLRGQIKITRAMLTEFQNAHELAFMLAHELGHRALRHGGLRYVFRRQEIEREADAYAMELMRRKGFDPRKTPRWFDRRIAEYSGAARRKMAARKAAILNLLEIEGDAM